ncbi:MAG: c-type cytochrome [Acidimicrobiia bacterium]|nr:c-type cytochrome [Acidimicrobiia bacterium]
MTSNIITVLAIVAGITWLGVLLVAAIRNRGSEEVPSNIRPGIDDQQLETRRLESGQKAAIAASAFLAVSLPLYFLSEPSRQEGFVEEFAHASEERGEHLVEEFACFSCHGPLGAGGSASFVEKRSGVTVSWEAPALNDVLYRYDEDELNFWITFGRGNTPMPAWGLAGGGPLNEAQVVDIVNYLKTIQIPQQEAAAKAASQVDIQISRLNNAEATVEEAILNQRQVLAEIAQAPADALFVGPLAVRARDLLDAAATGIDTDDDGLSDAVEAELSLISAEAYDYFQGIEPVTLDPEIADNDLLVSAMAQLEEGADQDPILGQYLAAVEAILEGQDLTSDSDGDGISDEAEAAISGQLAEASRATIPAGIAVVSLSPTSTESVPDVSDRATATRLVGGLESVAINTSVAAENFDKLFNQESAGLTFLLDAQRARAWHVDIAGVADSMGVGEEEAERAVALFNANCARCHTAGFSAGVPYTQEIGSGGFGPALWDGRPVVQFGEAADPEEDLLIQFLIRGSEAQKPYGLNGFGSGRMPAFGAVLSQEDIALLALYLRSGNLSGVE